jgi:hypothetical protein
MTHSESVHLCAEFTKLLQQPCPRSRAARKTHDIDDLLLMKLLMMINDMFTYS